MSSHDDFEARRKRSIAEVTAADVHSTTWSFRKDRLENGRIFLNKSDEIQNVGLCYTTVGLWYRVFEIFLTFAVNVNLIHSSGQTHQSASMVMFCVFVFVHACKDGLFWTEDEFQMLCVWTTIDAEFSWCSCPCCTQMFSHSGEKMYPTPCCEYETEHPFLDKNLIPSRFPPHTKVGITKEWLMGSSLTVFCNFLLALVIGNLYRRLFSYSQCHWPWMSMPYTS